MADDTETLAARAERLAVLIAPIGALSGDARWDAAECLRELAAANAQLERERARLRHGAAAGAAAPTRRLQ